MHAIIMSLWRMLSFYQTVQYNIIAPISDYNLLLLRFFLLPWSLLLLLQSYEQSRHRLPLPMMITEGSLAPAQSI
jgi:hypothetical protein